jgi:hypothetical protein
MGAPTKQTASFSAKAAELRAMAEAYVIPELRTGILEIADLWEQLERRIEADAAAPPKRYPERENYPEPEPRRGEEPA